MKRFVMITVIVFVFCATFSSAAEPIRRVLDNGVIAIVKENHNAPVVSIRAYIRAGSMFEEEYLGMGLSHYLEHMLFEGTSTMSGDEIDAARAEMGGIDNAYTWIDHTCYYGQVRNDNYQRYIELMCESLYDSILPSEAVENQREVIHSEFRMGYDEPIRVIFKMLYSTMFTRTPARHPVIGYEELFDRATRDDLLDYYHRRYIPENTILVVVGDVDAEQAFRKIEETFGEIDRGMPTATPFPDEPPQVGPRYANTEMDIDAAYLMLAFRTARVSTPDAFSLDVLSTIMGTGLNARLRQKLMYEKELVTDISCFSATPKEFDGYFVVYAECSEDKVDAAREAIYEEMMYLREKKVSKKDLERAKTLLEADNVLDLQTVEDQSDYLGIYELDTGNMNFGDAYLNYTNAVNADDIRDAAESYFYKDNMTVCTIMPFGSDEGYDKVTKSLYKPEIAKRELDNGLTVLVRSNPEAPSVRVVAAIDGGLRYVPTGKEGVADLVATMLLRGTGKRDREKIAGEIESRGGSIGASATRDSMTLGCQVLPDDSELAVDVVADCIRNSKFDEDVFEQERVRLYQQIQSEDDDWHNEAYKVLRKEMFGDHPYATLTTGTEESLNDLTVADAKAYYDSYLSPDNAIVSIFGDIEEEEAFELADKYFGKWKAGNTQAPTNPSVPPFSSNRSVAKETDKSQAVTYFAFAGIKSGDEDRYALDLLDSVLSGIYFPGGRLHYRLRGGNLVYVTHAYNSASRDRGFFGIYAASSPADQAEVQRIIAEEIERIKTEPVPADELERAKEVCATVDAVYNKQTDGDLASNATGGELAGLGYDYNDDYPERIMALTAEDVIKVAKKYLVNPLIVVASPPLEEGE